MPYEVFQRTAQRVEQPILSIIADGRIALNAASMRLFARLGIRSVLLLWDKSNSKLALKATARNDKNAYSVSASRLSGTIAAKSFFSNIGWNASKRVSLNATWNEKNKMLEVVLPSQHVGHSRKIGQRIVIRESR